jgi:4-amino-4-deoxy-L-arabinose transferase-like glycosyltransferase
MKLRIQNAAPTIAVAVVAAFAVGTAVLPTLFYPWFFSTEEAPYGQEVVRFITGDFRQRFFDIPGTPFMAVVALVFKAALVGLYGWEADPFSHLDLLFPIMRGLSGLAFAAAVLCMYLASRQIASTWAALLAAAVLALHPILATTLTHTRIEPTAVFIVTAAILAWLRGTVTGWLWFFRIAGLLAGLAMAARFQLALALLPVFVAYAFVYTQQGKDRTTKIDNLLFVVALAAAIAGGTVAAMTAAGFDLSPASEWILASFPGRGAPLATALIRKLWIGLALLAMAIFVAAALSLSRRYIKRYFNSSLAAVAGWFPLGVLIGTPTVLAGQQYVLTSVDNFIARNVYVPEFQNTTLKVINLFLFGANGQIGVLFTLPLLVLLMAAFRYYRRPVFWCIILACTIGVFSQLGKLQSTRHISGWLPWFCLWFALGLEAFHAAVPAPFKTAVAATVAAITIVPVLLDRTLALKADLEAQRIHADGVQRIQAWIQSSLPTDEPVFFACCKPVTADPILSAWRANGLSTPESRGVQWFGHRSTLVRAGNGYLVVAPDDLIGFYIPFFEKVDQSEMIDPRIDPHFTLIQRIAVHGNSSYEIYQFSFTEEPRLTSGGIAIIEATYGFNCNTATRAVVAGNMTTALKWRCNRRVSCSYEIDVVGLDGDPAPQCAKDFSTVWTCEDGLHRQQSIPAEANGKTVLLSCPSASP